VWVAPTPKKNGAETELRGMAEEVADRMRWSYKEGGRPRERYGRRWQAVRPALVTRQRGSRVRQRWR
jgi:hypothetical protein